MRDQLIGLLDRADLALASCAEVIERSQLIPLIEAVQAVRTRTTYPEDVLVVALAGGTGSGKSSLLNTLAGEELVDVGGVRPTTSRPAAAIPSGAGSSIDGYLDRLGIEDRHVYQGTGLCLIDLPDMDSVHTEHRHRVDALLPLVDVVAWVTDPEKYRDSRLHDDYLKPLAAYSAQIIIVVNQVDRLSHSQLDEVGNDLQAALEEDHLEDAMIVLTAAAPPSGPPIGFEELRRVLEEKRSDRHTLYGKLLHDLEATSRALSTTAGSGLDFDVRAGEALDRAAVALAAGQATDAGDDLTGLLDALAEETGGVTAAKLEAIAADVATHVRRIEGDLPPEKPSGPRWRWWRRRSRPEEPNEAEAARVLLSEAVIRPARAVLARRAVAIASVAEFAWEVENFRQRPRR